MVTCLSCLLQPQRQQQQQQQQKQLMLACPV
jgi:hypothetical protein